MGAKSTIDNHRQTVLFRKLDVLRATNAFQVYRSSLGKILQPCEIIPVHPSVMIRRPINIRLGSDSGFSIARSTLEFFVSLSMTEDVGVDCQ